MMPLSPAFQRLILSSERFVIAPFFLWFAYGYVVSLQFAYAAARLHAVAPHMPVVPNYQILNYVIMLVFNLCCAFLLLTARPATKAPQSNRDVIVPFIATFTMCFFNLADDLPGILSKSLIPDQLRFAFSVVGSFIFFCGELFAFWAILHLGRSFGVVVAVRKVISGGPYRFVRHPMYGAYVIETIGLNIINPRLGLFLISVFFVCMQVYRAKLEEHALAEADPEYLERMKTTGFFFPRIPRKPLPSVV